MPWRLPCSTLRPRMLWQRPAACQRTPTWRVPFMAAVSLYPQQRPRGGSPGCSRLGLKSRSWDQLWAECACVCVRDCVSCLCVHLCVYGCTHMGTPVLESPPSAYIFPHWPLLLLGPWCSLPFWVSSGLCLLASPSAYGDICLPELHSRYFGGSSHSWCLINAFQWIGKYEAPCQG